MATRLSLSQSSSFQPAPRETLLCKILMVGDTLAAYTATLAILQAGGQVCWVKPDKLDIAAALRRSPDLPVRFSSRLGRRASPWEGVVALSRSQQQFWQTWSAPGQSPTLTATEVSPQPAASAVPKTVPLRQAIAPYLSNQQLMLIAGADPLRVLYREQRGTRRVYQVVFRDRQTGSPFQVHPQLTLDATRDATLTQLLEATLGMPLAISLTLTVADICPEPPRPARGTFYADAIALAMVACPAQRQRSRPISIPLRSLLPCSVQGFLKVSHPQCDPALQPFWASPKVQWALGEAMGYLAANAISMGGLSALMEQPHWQWRLQQQLVQRGIPLFAYDDVPLEDPAFEAIQMGAIADVVRMVRLRDLSFYPETPVTRAVVASALSRLPGSQQRAAKTPLPPVIDVSPNHWAFLAVQQAIATGLITAPSAQFRPSQVVSKADLWQLLQPLYPPEILSPPFPVDDTPARRRHLSRGVYPILQAHLGQ